MEKQINNNIIKIQIDRINFNNNIRSEIKEENVLVLTKSITQYGQLHPVLVYKNFDNKYTLIYGHRRCLAISKAGIATVNCIVIDKPSEKDIIYLQANENENSKSLSQKERENYIKKLISLGESYDDVAKKLGMSTSWIRQYEIAAKTREKFQHIFDKYKFNPTITDLNQMSNASEEEIEVAMKIISEDKNAKTPILNEVNQQNKVKLNSGSKPKIPIIDKTKNPETFFNQYMKGLVPLTKKQSINLKKIHHVNDVFSLHVENITEMDELKVNKLVDLVYDFFYKKGYNVNIYDSIDKKE